MFVTVGSTLCLIQWWVVDPVRCLDVQSKIRAIRRRTPVCDDVPSSFVSKFEGKLPGYNLLCRHVRVLCYTALRKRSPQPGLNQHGYWGLQVWPQQGRGCRNGVATRWKSKEEARKETRPRPRENCSYLPTAYTGGCCHGCWCRMLRL